MGSIWWNLFGLVLFLSAFYLGLRVIRDKGRGEFADWLREKWPPKK